MELHGHVPRRRTHFNSLGGSSQQECRSDISGEGVPSRDADRKKLGLLPEFKILRSEEKGVGMGGRTVQ